MNDHEEQFLATVRSVLQEAGFRDPSAGAQGIHTVRHARGVAVGWVPQDIPRLRRRPRRHRSGLGELAGLRHAFGLALAAAFRGAGFTVETHGDDWLLIVQPDHQPEL
ncbi:hypothetical protein [Streptomyces sp. NPDC093225]|uniref:hypothetical protein n=1 Tax=Streptomyces sp. NPDC093225 TaxID=3366034 RepID=UPI003820A7D3